MLFRKNTTEEIKDPESLWFTFSSMNLLSGETTYGIKSQFSPSPIIDAKLDKELAEYIVECVNAKKVNDFNENWKKELEEAGKQEETNGTCEHLQGE